MKCSLKYSPWRSRSGNTGEAGNPACWKAHAGTGLGVIQTREAVMTCPEQLAFCLLRLPQEKTTPGGLTTEFHFLTALRSWKSPGRGAGVVSFQRGPSLPWLTDGCLPGRSLHALLSCVCVQEMASGVSSHKPIRSGPWPMTSFNISYFLKGPFSKHNHSGDEGFNTGGLWPAHTRLVLPAHLPFLCCLPILRRAGPPRQGDCPPARAARLFHHLCQLSPQAGPQAEAPEDGVARWFKD